MNTAHKPGALAPGFRRWRWRQMNQKGAMTRQQPHPWCDRERYLDHGVKDTTASPIPPCFYYWKLQISMTVPSWTIKWWGNVPFGCKWALWLVISNWKRNIVMSRDGRQQSGQTGLLQLGGTERGGGSPNPISPREGPVLGILLPSPPLGKHGVGSEGLKLIFLGASSGYKCSLFLKTYPHQKSTQISLYLSAEEFLNTSLG